MSSMYLFVSCLQLKAGVEKCTQQTKGIEKVNLRYPPSGTRHPVPSVPFSRSSSKVTNARRFSEAAGSPRFQPNDGVLRLKIMWPFVFMVFLHWVL